MRSSSHGGARRSPSALRLYRGAIRTCPRAGVCRPDTLLLPRLRNLPRAWHLPRRSSPGLARRRLRPPGELSQSTSPAGRSRSIAYSMEVEIRQRLFAETRDASTASATVSSRCATAAHCSARHRSPRRPGSPPRPGTRTSPATAASTRLWPLSTAASADKTRASSLPLPDDFNDASISRADVPSHHCWPGSGRRR